MFGASTLVSSTLVVLASLRAVAAADLVLQTPAPLKQCQGTDLTWSGHKGPVSLEVFTSCSDTNDLPVAVFEDVEGATLRWKDINVPGGSSVFFVLTDADGKEFVSQDFPVEATDAASCLSPDANPKPDANPTPDPALASESQSASVPPPASQTGSTGAPAPNVAAPAPAPAKTGTSGTNTGANLTPNNAAKDVNGGDPTGSDATTFTNSATSSVASRPLELAAGVLALAGALSFF